MQPQHAKPQYADLLGSLGYELVVEVTNRRGTALLKVSQGESLYALKLNVPDPAENVYDTVLLIKREASVLKRLGGLVHDLYVNHGQHNSTHWLLLRWLDGESVSLPSKLYRSMPDEQQKKIAFLKLFVSILEKYAAFHGAGYLHGDVQPHHIFMVSEVPAVIDWGLGKHVADVDCVYRGGLAHFASPEVARGMIERASNIPYDQLSEIYSIAAMFFVLFTGITPVNYGADDPMSVPLEQKLRCITQSNLTSFREAGSLLFPELELVLQKCLSSNRDERLSTTEFLKKLQEIRV